MRNAVSAGLATRLAFLAAGIGLASWAPLVPFAKSRLGIGDAELGLLLLCLGVGSVLAMLATGPLGVRFGSRRIINASGLAVAIFLPLLAIAPSPALLGLGLFAFGAAIGSLDVAMNMHAVQVERAAGRNLMSGFHALFSIGAFAGAGVVTLLLSAGWSPLAAAGVSAAFVAVAGLVARPGLLSTRGVAGDPLFALPRGIVLILALLAATTFLVEGAILDWSALLLTEGGLLPLVQGGAGFMAFSVTMTLGRLTGDAMTSRFGDLWVLIGGGVMSVAGFAILLTAPHAVPVLAGYALVGLGAANIVPILFRRAGAQTRMPPGLAIAAITTLAYGGMLLGPAAVGAVAEAADLRTAFWMLAGLMALVPLLAPVVARRTR